jgi:S1-C subfamily serine protease
VFSRISRLLDPLGFPDVFAQLEPSPPGRLGPPSGTAVAAAVAHARQSVVKIEGAGCGGLLEGSGFVVRSGLFVTNAHVIAGVKHPQVIDSAGSHPAVPVLFDPRLDVAVLRTGGVRGEPLALEPATVARGTQAAVMGYPGGGPFVAGGATVLARTEAVGRDIYGESLQAREIYQLEAAVRPGNSGGPVVSPAGVVLGVVFARSSSSPDIGYALTSAEVRARIQPALDSSQPVSTDGCAA